MALHKMAPVDAAWFHMDGTANLAMVTSVALTSRPLDFEKVKILYAHRLQAYPRFRQRVVEHGLPLPVPHWEDMPHFDLNQHMHHVALPAPGNRQALTELLNDIASAPLDRLQPLWQVHVIDGVGSGSALVTRFHHCIGDGTAMSALAQRLYDTVPDAPLEGPADGEPVAQDEPSGGWVETIVGAIARSTHAIASAADTAVHAITNPLTLFEKVAMVTGGTGMLLSELLKRDDPPSPFKGEFALAKRVAWSKPVAIADVKAIGALADAKVNDVLIAGMTGALRAYLIGRDVDVDHTTLRALVPVDLRPPERALELGNDFGLVLLELAVDAATPLERLRITKAHMDQLKRSAEPVAMRVLFDLFGRTPKAVSDIPSSMISNKASIVMTNVVGSPQTLYVAGAPIERVMFWVPHPGEHLGMGISILSYCGDATLALVADAHLVPDPQTITGYFEQEFVTLLAAARAARRPAKPVASTARKRSTKPSALRARQAAAKGKSRSTTAQHSPGREAAGPAVKTPGTKRTAAAKKSTVKPKAAGAKTR
jgi:WS/DGAT/MGAT family acyltransferase